MRRVGLALVLGLLAVPALAASYRFIGPWFTDATYNTATEAPSLIAGQNTSELGITFTCFDRHLSLGLWKPNGSLNLGVAARTTLRVDIDAFAPIFLVGVGTRPNLAEFQESIGLVMREMLAARQARLLFTDHDGRQIHESFRLDNAAIAFDGLARSCPL